MALDEPPANLDSELIEQVIDELYNLNKETSQTIIVATHNITMIRKNTRAIELIDGKITRDGLVLKK